MANAEISQFEEFIRQLPELSIVSDNPLKKEDLEDEQFNLRYRVGPVYDIIRHDKTQTPMTIAVYGTWGTGKTTAMLWLDRLLRGWNDYLRDNPALVERERKEGRTLRKVRTVWFYPWKYHEKEDVWRGLVSEVIIESIDVKNLTFSRAKKALKDFGLFLGRSFLNVIASASIKAEVSAGSDDLAKGKAGLDIDLKNIKEIAADFDRTAHPEKAFLNEFEDTLRKWIRETISSQDERMVIFIDDLDRCTPDVAFEVLEALKLYLNITDLIFVVGLDREVVDKVVENHYKKMGFETEAEKKKSKKYLDKMFQVEVKVGPSQKQIEDYTNHIFDRNEFLRNNMEQAEYEAVKDVVLSLCERNPREIKRLVNSALMEGMGASLISQEVAKETKYSVAQGVQVFLIDAILQKRFPPSFKNFIGSGRDVEFFGEWSSIVRKHFSENLSKASITLPAAFKDSILDEGRRPGHDYVINKHIVIDKEINIGGRGEQPPKQAEKATDWIGESDIPAEFHDLLRNSRYAAYLPLLEDEDLGRLMLIEYPE
ncbi:MAG: KAP family P-loop NTPase fold protein, partial [Planctomycetota bacterium]